MDCNWLFSADCWWLFSPAVNSVAGESISVSESDVNDFLSFLESEETYLDTGLGAFHTDNHSNW